MTAFLIMKNVSSPIMLTVGLVSLSRNLQKTEIPSARKQMVFSIILMRMFVTNISNAIMAELLNFPARTPLYLMSRLAAVYERSKQVMLPDFVMELSSMKWMVSHAPEVEMLSDLKTFSKPIPSTLTQQTVDTISLATTIRSLINLGAVKEMFSTG